MTSLRQIALLALPCLAAALGLGACGSGSDSSSADVKEITGAIVTSGTTETESECTEMETQRFVEQISSEKGQAAIDACKEAGDTNAEKIDVSDVKVDGDGATAIAAIAGGTFDGQSLRVSLIREDGKWKLDYFDGFESFDKAKLVDALTAALSGSSETFTPEQGQCIGDALGEAGDTELQEIILSGDSNRLVPFVKPCLTQ